MFDPFATIQTGKSILDSIRKGTVKQDTTEILNRIKAEMAEPIPDTALRMPTLSESVKSKLKAPEYASDKLFSIGGLLSKKRKDILEKAPTLSKMMWKPPKELDTTKVDESFSRLPVYQQAERLQKEGPQARYKDQLNEIYKKQWHERRDKLIKQAKDLPKDYKEPGDIGQLFDTLQRGLTTIGMAAGGELETFGQKYSVKTIEKLGAKFRDLTYKKLLQNPEWEPPEDMGKWGDPTFYIRIVGEGLPTIIGGTLVALASSPAGPVGEAVALYGYAKTLEGGLAYNEAMDMDVPHDEALKIADKIGRINAAMEAIPIFQLMNKTPFGKAVKKSLLKKTTGYLAKKGALAFEEGSTEAGQEVVSNLVFSDYDENRKLYDNLLESFVGGALTMGATDISMDIMNSPLAKEALQQLKKNKKGEARLFPDNDSLGERDLSKAEQEGLFSEDKLPPKAEKPKPETKPLPGQTNIDEAKDLTPKPKQDEPTPREPVPDTTPDVSDRSGGTDKDVYEAGEPVEPTPGGRMAAARERVLPRLSQVKIRDEARKIISKPRNEITEQDKQVLRKYEGIGGREKEGAEGKGLLSEYYTPKEVVNQVWELVKKHGFKEGGRVIEPSAGTGRFIEAGPKANYIGIEMDEVSAKIAEILTGANIKQMEFENLFVDKAGNNLNVARPIFDLVIGNPPYGKTRGHYRHLDEKNIPRYEEYFIKKGLDILKDGGLLAMVVPSAFLKTEITQAKRLIAEQGALIEAIRLPEGTFKTTQIGTDIVIFKKSPISKEMAGVRAMELSDDKYFRNPMNAQRIQGEVKTRINRYKKEETYVAKKQKGNWITDEFKTFEDFEKNLGEKLYLLNKKAKEIRDETNAIKKDLFEDNPRYAIEPHSDIAFTSEEDYEDYMQDNFFEPDEDWFEEHPEYKEEDVEMVDSYNGEVYSPKEWEDYLEKIDESREEIDKLHKRISRISDERMYQDELYEIKDKVLKNLDLPLKDIHEFEADSYNYYPLYELGGFKFHIKVDANDIDEIKGADKFDLKNLKELEEIGADKEIDKVFSPEDEKFLKKIKDENKTIKEYKALWTEQKPTEKIGTFAGQVPAKVMEKAYKPNLPVNQTAQKTAEQSVVVTPKEKLPRIPEVEEKAPIQEEISQQSLNKQITAIINRYEDGDNQIATVSDIVIEVETIAEDSNDPRALKILNEIEKYRELQIENEELKGRGDMDSADENFLDRLNGIIKVKEASTKPKIDTGEPILTSGQYYKSSVQYSDDELSVWNAKRSDGSVDTSKLSDDIINTLNVYRGQYFDDFDYLSGNIYEKLEALMEEKISDGQKKKQESKLKKVLPRPKTIKDFNLNPVSEFTRMFKIDDQSLMDIFEDYLRDLPPDAFRPSDKFETIGYLNNVNVYADKDEKLAAIIKERRKKSAEKLFDVFINQLDADTQKKISDVMNYRLNAYVRPDYTKVPLTVKGLDTSFGGRKLLMPDYKLDSIGFLSSKGLGINANGVGLGKTMMSIISTVQDMQKGWYKRPLFIVPRAVYDKWISEIKMLFPNQNVVGLSNLGAETNITYTEDILKHIKDGDITVITHDAIMKLGFKKETIERLSRDLENAYDINSLIPKTKRQKEKDKTKTDETVGKARLRANIEIEELGFDNLVVDEAHNFKNIFSRAKSLVDTFSIITGKKPDKREHTGRWTGLQGPSSARGVKMWFLSQYIQELNDGRGVKLLTATPFSNNPLEYYNMLSLIAMDEMKDMGISNINTFMDTFIRTKSKFVVKAGGQFKKADVVEDWINKESLKEFITRYIDFKDGRDYGIKRPEKSSKEYKLNPTKEQLELIQEAQELLGPEFADKGGVLRYIDEGKKITLSPFLSRYYRGEQPTYKTFIEKSPKLNALMHLIRANEKRTGQLIYYPMSIETMPMIKEYLVNELNYTDKEVQLIHGGTDNKKRNKIRDDFNAGTVKVIIGSDAVKEGMDLQGNSTDLYITSYPWRPTDITQAEGRIHRQGNKWKNVRIHYLSVNDSIDPFLYQKLETKAKRLSAATPLEQAMDVSEVDWEKSKTELIHDPRARLELEKAEEKGAIETEMDAAKAELAIKQSLLNKEDELVEEIEKYKTGLNNSTDTTKKYWQNKLKNAERKLKALQEKEIDKDELGAQISVLKEQIKPQEEKITAINKKYDEKEKNMPLFHEVEVKPNDFTELETQIRTENQEFIVSKDEPVSQKNDKYGELNKRLDSWSIPEDEIRGIVEVLEAENAPQEILKKSRDYKESFEDYRNQILEELQGDVDEAETAQTEEGQMTSKEGTELIAKWLKKISILFAKQGPRELWIDRFMESQDMPTFVKKVQKMYKEAVQKGLKWPNYPETQALIDALHAGTIDSLEMEKVIRLLPQYLKPIANERKRTAKKRPVRPKESGGTAEQVTQGGAEKDTGGRERTGEEITNINKKIINKVSDQGIKFNDKYTVNEHGVVLNPDYAEIFEGTKFKYKIKFARTKDRGYVFGVSYDSHFGNYEGGASPVAVNNPIWSNDQFQEGLNFEKNEIIRVFESNLKENPNAQARKELDEIKRGIVTKQSDIDEQKANDNDRVKVHEDIIKTYPKPDTEATVDDVPVTITAIPDDIKEIPEEPKVAVEDNEGNQQIVPLEKVQSADDTPTDEPPKEVEMLTLLDVKRDPDMKEWVPEPPKEPPVPPLTPERTAKAWPSGNPPDRKYVQLTRLEKLRYIGQDKMLPLLKLQWEAPVLNEEEDTYLNELLYRQRRNARLEDLSRRFDDINDKINALIDSPTTEEKTRLRAMIFDYAHVLHAPERNKVHWDGAAGVSTNDAFNYQRVVKAHPRFKDISAGAQILREESRKLIDFLLKEELITQKDYDKLISTYKYYVPLQRIIDDHTDFVNLMAIGTDYDVRGKEVKRAIGGMLPIDDIFAHTFLNWQKAIIRSEKNKIGQALMRFAETYPDLGVFEIMKGIPELQFHEDIGPYWVQVAPKDEEVLSVKVKGKSYYIKVHDKNIINAFRSLDTRSINLFVRLLRPFTRFISVINTAVNPEFIFTNPTRDIQQATLNLVHEIGWWKSIKTAADFPKAAKGIFIWYARRSKNKGVVKQYMAKKENAWADLYEELRLEGGTTGFFNIKDIDNIKEIYSEMEKAWALTAIGKPISKTGKSFKAIAKGIDVMNSTMENAMRLATYKKMLDLGKSKKRAAASAKNVTVNFDKMGMGGPTINALYAFANASIQGNVRMLKSLKTPKGAFKTIMPIVTLALLMNLWNDWFDEEDAEKIPDYEKESNWTILTGDRYIKLALPWGYNVFKVMTDYAYNMAKGKVTASHALNRSILALINAYNPLGGSSLWQAITPTVVRPFFEVKMHHSWGGWEISPRNYTGIKESLNYRESTNIFWKKAAEFISEATGGKGAKPGLIEYSPEDIEYIYQQYTGGLGKFIMNTTLWGRNVFKGEETPIHKIPIIRRFRGQIDSERTNLNNIYEILDRSKEVILPIKEKEKLTDLLIDEAVMGRIDVKDIIKHQKEYERAQIDLLDIEKEVKFIKENNIYKDQGLLDLYLEGFQNKAFQKSRNRNTLNKTQIKILKSHL